MTEPTPEELEKIKAACAGAGVVFVGIDILVKHPEPAELERPDIKTIWEKTVFEFEFNGRHSTKTSGRKRYGKRPKFYGQD